MILAFTLTWMSGLSFGVAFMFWYFDAFNVAGGNLAASVFIGIIARDMYKKFRGSK